MGKTVRIKINGQQIEAHPGQTILEVVREKKLDDIPTLCHSEELEPYGSCFLCVVEVKGRPILVPACATRIARDMEIETRNDRIIASRKTALELLLSNHYADCVSPCMLGCPAGVDAQGYIALSAMGLYREAVDLIRETNPLPAICGRVCVRKCEVVCRREDIDRSVGINAIKRYVTDAPGIYEGTPATDPPTGKTVGIIGAGPAGLTAAWFLALKGHKPVLYEAKERAGGMLRYGIPVYRLPDEVMDREVEFICRAGAEIHYQTRIGQDVPLEDLRKRHDALFLATGAWNGKPMRVDGEFDTEGVVTGADFLPEMTDRPEPLSGTVVVVGGGNTAMDVARTSWRLGADKVIVLYRRTRAEMPADEMEIEDCLDEGIEIMELAAPVGIMKDNGRLKSLKCIRMKLGEPDDSGRRRPVPQEGSEFELPCDLAVSAIGQEPVMEGLSSGEENDLKLTRWSTFVVDTETMETNIESIFAGGDAADDGPTVVIDAIRDGQRAAKAMHAFLLDKEPASKPFIVTKEFWSKPGQSELGEVKESPRHEVHLNPVEERSGNFDEVATGFEYEDNVHECARCLSCGCIRYDDCDLRLYAEAYNVDMNRFAGYARKHKVDARHPYIVYDPNKCVLCSRCIRTCARVLPISALGLVGRGFKTEMRPAMNDPLVETSCVSCGNCVDACPTGALAIKYPFPGWSALETGEVTSHCGFCSLGCAISVKQFGKGRYYIDSSGKPGEYLCRYGRFGVELFIKQNRITDPQAREKHARSRIPWEDANEKIVHAMRDAVEKYGPESVGVFASPELTNEELYLAGRIAREGLGTNNIASLTILGTGGEPGLLDTSLGFTASTADRTAVRDADLIICNNTSLGSDHLILAVEVIQSVKQGAGFIICNSTLETIDTLLASQTLDPMRGRTAILWNGVIQVLLDQGYFDDKEVRKIPGAGEFLKKRDFPLDLVSSMTGVDEEDIQNTAALVGEAKKIVFIHSPDRPQDQAPGDLETLANFIILLRAAGVEAELLLPRMSANGAGMEVVGADPKFLPGKAPSPGLAGARDHEELRKLLKEGKIRAALIIGEDPMNHDRTASFFQNVIFLAAIDWTETETTQFADVVLPASTFLETEGTRCNFEGRLIRFARAVETPSGIPGWKVLLGLAEQFGIEMRAKSVDDLTRKIQDTVLQQLNGLASFYWNTGEKRTAVGREQLVPANSFARAPSIQPPLIHGERYKREILEVGTERYRVR